jgi:hypothetical protein
MGMVYIQLYNFIHVNFINNSIDCQYQTNSFTGLLKNK